MDQIDRPRFAWHARSYDRCKASVRLRVLDPIAALADRGIAAGTFGAGDRPGDYAGIVFSKSFSREAIGIAEAARNAGSAVILDLCDNPFGCRTGAAKLDRLRHMARLATRITAATPVLAAQLGEILPETTDRLRVVPDMLDDPGACDADAAGRRDGQALAGLARFLAAHQDALHCIWFGKSRGDVSGFAHLGRAVAELERFAGARAVTLTVVSNSRWRYWRAATGWRLPTHYMPWSLATFGAALARHDVAVIPVAHNAYTAGKTLNRPATAIAAGLGVIADSIASYEELRPFIALDDWQGGLARYAARGETVDRALAAGKAHLDRRYSRDAVAGAWATMLDEAAAQGSSRLASP